MKSSTTSRFCFFFNSHLPIDQACNFQAVISTACGSKQQKADKAKPQTSFLSLRMADKHGRTLAKGCLKICRKMIFREMVSLQMIMESICVLEMGFIKVNQIPRLLFGKKRFFLTNIAALPLVRLECLHSTTVASFYKR